MIVKIQLNLIFQRHLFAENVVRFLFYPNYYQNVLLLLLNKSIM